MDCKLATLNTSIKRKQMNGLAKCYFVAARKAMLQLYNFIELNKGIKAAVLW